MGYKEDWNQEDLTWCLKAFRHLECEHGCRHKDTSQSKSRQDFKVHLHFVILYCVVLMQPSSYGANLSENCFPATGLTQLVARSQLFCLLAWAYTETVSRKAKIRFRYEMIAAVTAIQPLSSAELLTTARSAAFGRKFKIRKQTSDARSRRRRLWKRISNERVGLSAELRPYQSLP